MAQRVVERPARKTRSPRTPPALSQTRAEELAAVETNWMSEDVVLKEIVEAEESPKIILIMPVSGAESFRTETLMTSEEMLEMPLFARVAAEEEIVSTTLFSFDTSSSEIVERKLETELLNTPAEEISAKCVIPVELVGCASKPPEADRPSFRPCTDVSI